MDPVKTTTFHLGSETNEATSKDVVLSANGGSGVSLNKWRGICLGFTSELL